MTTLCDVHNWSNEMFFLKFILGRKEERYYLLSRPLVKQTCCTKNYVVALKYILPVKKDIKML